MPASIKRLMWKDPWSTFQPGMPVEQDYAGKQKPDVVCALCSAAIFWRPIPVKACWSDVVGTQTGRGSQMFHWQFLPILICGGLILKVKLNIWDCRVLSIKNLTHEGSNKAIRCQYMSKVKVRTLGSDPAVTQKPWFPSTENNFQRTQPTPLKTIQARRLPTGV